MPNIGDTVRYLNATGGGIIRRIEGRMAFVEEDGFETPVLLSELVTVLPAGHQAMSNGASLMFDQKAYDRGRQSAPEAPAQKTAQPAPAPAATPEPAEETAHGDRLSITLAFEPADTKRLSETTFTAVLVNDSNYYLDFTFLTRGDGERGWTVAYRGTAAPNELTDLATCTHETLGRMERVALQAVAYKNDRPFSIKPPVSATRRLDLTKFHKLHCFRPGLYFDTPVLELPLVKDDVPTGTQAAPAPQTAADPGTARLAEKYRTEPARKPRTEKEAENPRKLLPPIEIDLHIAELTDSTAGMEPADMLALQLDTVRTTMKAHSRRIGQKIIFIHGKGEGVLRKELLKLLRREWPSAEVQDASFREYGFGATLITIHNPRS